MTGRLPVARSLFVAALAFETSAGHAHADVISGPRAYVLDALVAAPVLIGVAIVVGIVIWMVRRGRKR